ncbi:MAG: cytochrome P450 [Halioglobus sp.]|nr:cytochrome P450 [Halioglobus sp.]
MEITEALANHDVKAARRYFKAHGRPDLSAIPGNRGWPILGHVPAFLSDVHKLLDRQYARYGDVFILNGPRTEGVFMLGPEANELLLKNEGQLFSNFLAWDLSFADVFDNNVLERDFSGHKRHRKILQLAFKRPSVEGHIELMGPLIERGVADLPLGRKFKLMPFIKRLLLDVGANVFLGEEVGEQADRLNKAFIDMVASAADPFRVRIPFTPYMRGVAGRRVLSDYVYGNIDSKRSSDGRDLFTQLCQLTDEEDGSRFSDEEICDHITFLLFAAHDTTTSAMCSVLFSLADNPEWQDILADEIRGIGVDALTHDDLDRMVNATLVIQEALRMYPPLVMMPRYALREFEFHGHRIPANTTCAISSLFTHYMEDYWSEPHRFDPARFTPERAEEKGHFFQYIPFGGGAHKCLGLHFAQVQGKIFLYHFLRRYRVSKEPGQHFRYNNVPLTFPTNGLPLTLHRRG